MLKSKIHRAVVTDKSLHYEGSITIDSALMKAAGLIDNEKVQVYDINNGNRFETYVIKGKKGSGDMCVNGAAARLVKKGDLIIVVAFALMSPAKAKKFKPRLVKIGAKNRIRKGTKR